MIYNNRYKYDITYIEKYNKINLIINDTYTFNNIYYILIDEFILFEKIKYIPTIYNLYLILLDVFSENNEIKFICA